MNSLPVMPSGVLLPRPLSLTADQRTAHHQDPGINSPLVLMHNGREVLVTGHVSCVKGDDYEIQATATQSTTGARCARQDRGPLLGPD